ncbi:MAG: hypothetical protein ABJP34_07640 [Erythrobacter sp.]
MKLRAIWTLLAAMFLAACNPSAMVDSSEAEIARYHEHWNKGGVEPIWIEADDEFRANVEEAEYKRLMGDFQEIFGPVESTERQSFNVNAVNGITNVTVEMKTQFANGAGTEKFEFVQRGSDAKLKSYNLDSELLAGYDFSGGSEKPAEDAQITD